MARIGSSSGMTEADRRQVRRLRHLRTTGEITPTRLAVRLQRHFRTENGAFVINDDFRDQSHFRHRTVEVILIGARPAERSDQLWQLLFCGLDGRPLELTFDGGTDPWLQQQLVRIRRHQLAAIA